MAVIGTATLNVVPKISGLSDSVKKAMPSGSEAGSKYGESFSKGFGAKQGIIIGAFSAITSKAMSAVSSSMDSAISRFDTMNNFPIVMKNLGYSTEEAQSSIDLLSSRLSNLPTTLDSMVSLTQGLTTSIGDLGKSTEVALAINDMLVAGGASTQQAASAQEQFQQILAKGKPEMQDWRSLVTAMPGQMDQLAKHMLGPTAGANDLYDALGGGKNDPTITLDELMNAMVELDTKGGDSIVSFSEQAETAAGGVETSISNMRNAVTKGIASVMDEIGKDTISGVFNDMKAGINDAFAFIRELVPSVMPVVKEAFEAIKSLGSTAFGALKAVIPTVLPMLSLALDAIKQFGPAILAGAGAVMAFQKLKGVVDGVIGAVSGLTSPLGLATAAIGLLAGAVTLGITSYMDYKKKVENMEKATTGFSDAVSRASGLDEYNGKIEAIGKSSATSAKSVDELAEATAGHVDRINEITEEAEAQIGSLNSAKAVIEQYAGQSDLSADAQGRLEYALKTVNDELGLQLTAADVAAGAYKDQEGNVHDLVASIDELIEKKKQEIKMDALSESLSEAYEARADASKTYSDAIKERADSIDWLNMQLNAGNLTQGEYDERMEELNNKVADSKKIYDEAGEAIDNLNEQLGDTAKSTSESADAFDKWGNTVDGVFTEMISDAGGLPALKDDLRALGASTDDLAKLSEDDLQQIGLAYNGTASSIAGILDDLGVGLSNFSEETKANMGEIQDTFDSMDLSTVFQEAGVDVSEFSLKLADAGVSTETLAALGSDNLARLAEACDYNISDMVAAIQGYNGTPILDKNGNIQVDEASLIDAEGRVYNWNSTSGLTDKDGSIVVDDVELVDAYGNVVEWNGKKLESKQATANVGGNMKDAINTRQNWNSGSLLEKRTNAYIDIYVTEHKSTKTETKNAAGGFRLHGDGGIRYHADGYIATRATVMPPIDIVGEAGAEAIVPLTNRTYAMPFVEMIAEAMESHLAKGKNVNQVFNVYSDNPDLVAAKAMSRMRRAIA